MIHFVYPFSSIHLWSASVQKVWSYTTTNILTYSSLNNINQLTFAPSLSPLRHPLPPYPHFFPPPRLHFPCGMEDERWFGLCCLMTPGLSKDIRCHVWPYFLQASANQQIRHKATHKVGCQPGDFAYDHFNLPPGFVWVYMGLTYSLYHPEGRRMKEKQNREIPMHEIQ